jgi:hypothetical protein
MVKTKLPYVAMIIFPPFQMDGFILAGATGGDETFQAGAALDDAEYRL